MGPPQFAWSYLAAGADDAQAATAELRNAAGATVGSATLEATPNGTLVHAKFDKLPPGSHAFHIHAIGKCDPPFKSAG